MSWKADTLAILSDTGSTVMTVKRPVVDFDTYHKIHPLRSSTIIETSTVQVFPASRLAGGGFNKSAKGDITGEEVIIYFPYTSTVSVGDRLYPPTGTDYYEVSRVDGYEDHVRVRADLVEGRES